MININDILESNLTPNEYIVLYCLKNSLKISEKIDVDQVKPSLISMGLVTSDFNLTSKADLYVKSAVQSTPTGFAKEYRELFPAIRLPSGAYARVSEQDLDDALRKFIKRYKYDKETILKATKIYIESFENNSYNYMKNSYSFISKRGEPSALAAACEAVENGADTPETVRKYMGSNII
jgi:ribosomal protein S21